MMPPDRRKKPQDRHNSSQDGPKRLHAILLFAILLFAALLTTNLLLVYCLVMFTGAHTNAWAPTGRSPRGSGARLSDGQSVEPSSVTILKF